MIPVEVVVRYVAAGSYCKRNPEVASGTLLDKPIVEFYLKTTNKRYQQFELSVDDPLLHPVQGDGWHIFNPNLPLDQGDLRRAPLSEKEQTKLTCRLNTCHTLALEVGDILRVAWEQQSGLLQDFKVEFGVLSGERIVLADVIDADSWRVKRNGAQLSKQGYRDGDSLEEVLKIYQLIAGLTDAMLR
jgi:phosphoribosylaminoimidazole-succinocarboxamide synthase